MNTTTRPIISLPVCPPEDGSPYYNLNPEYTDAIRRAAGDPLAFPLVPNPANVDRMIALVHGLLADLAGALSAVFFCKLLFG